MAEKTFPQGKVPRLALVTGGGSGIGAAAAHALAAAGFEVVVCGRRPEQLAAVTASIAARGGRAHAVAADVTAPTDLERLLRETQAHGTVTALVNNAGIGESAPLRATDDALWERHLAINLTAAFRLCRALAPAMAAAGGGRIVNVASNAARTGYPYTAAYSASKAGLVGLTLALAAELGGKGVICNAVCPGWVETDLLARSVANITAKTKLSADDARARLADANPGKRFMTPEEVAAAIAFLCSDAAAGINGQAINVDGGAVMG